MNGLISSTISYKDSIKRKWKTISFVAYKAPSTCTLFNYLTQNRVHIFCSV